MLKLCHFLLNMVSNSNLLFFWSIVLIVVNSSSQLNSFFDSAQNSEYDLFLCSDKSKLIFLEYRCNGVVDCLDGSDEKLCNCPAGHFRASAGYCVPSLIYFIQHRYCHSKANQRVCYSTCKPTEFRCSSSKCIDKSKVCDGVADCGFSIDEWHDCEPEEEKIKRHGCKVDELPCYLKSGIRCAKFYEECLYYHECEIDGCDPNFECPNQRWRCFGGPCLKRRFLIDGKANCLGGADESYNADRWKQGKDPIIGTKGLSREGSSPVLTFAKYILSIFLICAIGVQLYMMKNNYSRRFKRYFFKK